MQLNKQTKTILQHSIKMSKIIYTEWVILLPAINLQKKLFVRTVECRKVLTLTQCQKAIAFFLFIFFSTVRLKY